MVVLRAIGIWLGAALLTAILFAGHEMIVGTPPPFSFIDAHLGICVVWLLIRDFESRQ